MIRLKEIQKIYSAKQQDVKAVDNVSLTIDKGEIYGIVGYSGAGKSTLVRMLNGLEKPTAGDVYINDKNLNDLSNRELRKTRQKIGMIFQHFNLLWSRTVKENILFPLEIANLPKNEREERAEELIRLVGLEGKEDAYPSEISGGQKQRVGIARALANDPQVLLCDEATSALDPQTTNDILDLLLEINRRLNLTIVIITHEMDVIRKICNRVAVMQDGKVVEEGFVDDIFKNPTQEITKQFIQHDLDADSANLGEVFGKLKQQNPNSRLLQLKFHGEKAQTPIISSVSRQFGIDVNIIQGNIQPSKDSLIGSLYVQLLGNEADIEATIQELRKQDVDVEAIDFETIH